MRARGLPPPFSSATSNGRDLRNNPVYRVRGRPSKSTAYQSRISFREPIYLAGVDRGFRRGPLATCVYPGDLSGDPTVIGTGCFITVQGIRARGSSPGAARRRSRGGSVRCACSKFSEMMIWVRTPVRRHLSAALPVGLPRRADDEDLPDEPVYPGHALTDATAGQRSDRFYFKNFPAGDGLSAGVECAAVLATGSAETRRVFRYRASRRAEIMAALIRCTLEIEAPFSAAVLRMVTPAASFSGGRGAAVTTVFSISITGAWS